MEHIVDGIVEVQEGGQKKANYLLERGYRLLSVTTEAKESRMVGNGNPYVRRSVTYVLGRTEAVAHAEVPKAAKQGAKEPVAA